MDYKQSVGEKIYSIRKGIGLTLKDLALRVGITEATMQKYEAGQIKRVGVDMIEKFSAALGVSPAYLMGWEDENGNLERPVSLDELKDEAVSSSLADHNRIFQTVNYRIVDVGDRYRLEYGADENGSYSQRVIISQEDVDDLLRNVDQYASMLLENLFNKRKTKK